MLPRNDTKVFYKTSGKLLYFPLHLLASWTLSFLDVSATPPQAITWPSKVSHFQRAMGIHTLRPAEHNHPQWFWQSSEVFQVSHTTTLHSTHIPLILEHLSGSLPDPDWPFRPTTHSGGRAAAYIRVCVHVTGHRTQECAEIHSSIQIQARMMQRYVCVKRSPTEISSVLLNVKPCYSSGAVSLT